MLYSVSRGRCFEARLWQAELGACPTARRDRSKLGLRRSGRIPRTASCAGNLLVSAFSRLQRRHLDLLEQAGERGFMDQMAKQMRRGSTTALGRPYHSIAFSIWICGPALPPAQLLLLRFSVPKSPLAMMERVA